MHGVSLIEGGRYASTSIAEGKRERGEEISGNFIAEVPNDATLGEGSYGKVWRAKDRRSNVWYSRSRTPKLCPELGGVCSRVGRERCSHVHERLLAFTVHKCCSELNTV